MSPIDCLTDLGFDSNYLDRNLIGFSQMVHCQCYIIKSGVVSKLTEIFPNMWHCLNHRLQLALDDSICEIK